MLCHSGCPVIPGSSHGNIDLERNSLEVFVVMIVHDFNKSVSALAHKVEVASVKSMVMWISRTVAFLFWLIETVFNTSIFDKLLFSELSTFVVSIWCADAVLSAVAECGSDLYIIAIKSQTSALVLWDTTSVDAINYLSIMAWSTDASLKLFSRNWTFITNKSPEFRASVEIGTAVSTASPFFIYTASDSTLADLTSPIAERVSRNICCSHSVSALADEGRVDITANGSIQAIIVLAFANNLISVNVVVAQSED